MSEVKALYPIGKTQWRKWGDEARTAYNTMRARGFTHETGVAEANAVERRVRADKPKKSILDVIEDIGEAAETVAEVAATVAPVVATVRTVARAARAAKPRKSK